MGQCDETVIVSSTERTKGDKLNIANRIYSLEEFCSRCETMGVSGQGRGGEHKITEERRSGD